MHPNMRSSVFWLTDRLKGGKIRNHYNDVRFLIENPFTTEAVSRKDQYLARILEHARETVPCYQSKSELSVLADFPVVNKEIIRSDADAYISSKYKKESLFGVTTSGSTGTPFKVFKDKGKLTRHHAENIYFSELAGFYPGTRLYYLRVWNSVNRKSRILSWIQNLVMYDTGYLSLEKMAGFFQSLKADKQSKTLLTYASNCEGIIRYIEETGIKADNLNVKSIITISETLPEHTKTKLKESFKCPVISRYSNMENGFIAQQCIEENNEYHINTASFHIELLAMDKDEPVQPGKMGRVVITDLFNYAMPLIRYDTGDIATLREDSSCSLKTPVFKGIEGRRMDFIYSSAGHLLSPGVIANTMWKYPVRQFQFIQQSEKEYYMKLNPNKQGRPDEKKLLSELKNYLGEDAVISFDYVDEIPVLASGKRKKIVNNYKP
jgi:phenylacetate-CoA ligase